MTTRVQDLLAQIPRDSKARVEQTLKNWNTSIREAVRSEMALGLRFEDVQRVVPVSVDKIGYPAGFAEIRIPEKHRLSAQLSLHRGTLLELERSAAASAEMLARMGQQERQPVFGDHWEPVFREAHQGALHLLREVGDFRLGRWLYSLVDDDLLGAYSYLAVDAPSRPSLPELPPDREPRWRRTPADASEESHTNAERTRREEVGSIELYWGVIALVAMSVGAPVEAMAAVVLTHELAHAYTHQGFDIDGQAWGNAAFAKTERAVKEGLAQYYTARIAGQFDGRIARLRETFERLLEEQPDVYRAHERWLHEASPEAVRTALVLCRPRGAVDYEAFSGVIEGHVARTGRRPTR